MVGVPSRATDCEDVDASFDLLMAIAPYSSHYSNRGSQTAAVGAPSTQADTPSSDLAASKSAMIIPVRCFTCGKVGWRWKKWGRCWCCLVGLDLAWD